MNRFGQFHFGEQPWADEIRKELNRIESESSSMEKTIANNRLEHYRWSSVLLCYSIVQQLGNKSKPKYNEIMDEVEQLHKNISVIFSIEEDLSNLYG